MYKVSLFIVIGLVALIVFSCNQKPCEDISCLNKGIKIFDTDNCYCNCLNSTRGNNCEINLIDSIEGYYNETDDCTLNTRINLISRVDSSHFKIRDLASIICSSGIYYVSIEVKDTLVNIDSQYVCPLGANYLIYGSGTIDYITNKINVNYYLNYSVGGSNLIDSCEVFYEKL